MRMKQMPGEGADWFEVEGAGHEVFVAALPT